MASLRAYIDSYQGGKTAGGNFVRSMEGMIQQIAADSAAAVKVPVKVRARLRLAPDQRMKLTCKARP